jgi:hypothetical protein
LRLQLHSQPAWFSQQQLATSQQKLQPQTQQHQLTQCQLNQPHQPTQWRQLTAWQHQLMQWHQQQMPQQHQPTQWQLLPMQWPRQLMQLHQHLLNKLSTSVRWF